MKTTTSFVLCGLFVLITWLQHEPILAAIISLMAWPLMILSHPTSLSRYWYPALIEYWVASLVWIGTAVWLFGTIFTAISDRKKPVGGYRSARGLSWLSAPDSQSVFAIGLLAYVAVTAPFLAPIDPNVQGNLMTTRLLPPLSQGYVREYTPKDGFPDGVTQMERIFHSARNHVLNRIVSVSGNPDLFSPQSVDEKSLIAREFRTVFLFGTDDNGRDVFSRVVAGTRISLGIGISAALGALLIGAIVGLAAGMSRGFVDAMLMRLTDLFLAIPGLFLVIGILGFVGESLLTIVLVLSTSGWMGIARVVRGEVISLGEREFVLAARLLQVPRWRIMTRHLVPNLRPLLIVSAALQFANAVLGEAALGFLGLGIQPPTATWGNMMGEATGYLSSAWWIGVFPGIFLATMIVFSHSIGERSVMTSGVPESIKDSVQE